MKFLVFSLVFILGISNLCFGNIENEQPPLLDINLSIESNHVFYKGVPAYVPITIINTQKESVQITEWNVFYENVPISIELIDTNDQKYSSSINRFAFILGEIETDRGARSIDKEKWVIESKENRRCLVNIGYAIEKINVPAGEYRMRICVWKDIHKVAGFSDEKIIRIADIPSEDSQWLSENIEVLPTGIKKIKHTINPSDIEAIPSKGIREQLAFNIILIILSSQKSLNDTQIEGYQNFVPEYLSPEIDLFEYEILLANQKKDKAKQLQKKLMRKFPSMEYWLNRAEKGQGYINMLKLFPTGVFEKNVRFIDPNVPR